MPYNAVPTEDSRLPPVPDHLQHFLPIFEQSLAADIDKRFATAGLFAEARNTAATHKEATQQAPRVRTQNISTQELRELGGSVLATPLDVGRQKASTSKVRRRRAVRRAVMASVLVAATGAGYVYLEQNQLIVVDEMLSALGITEDPQLTAAWNDAQSLSQDPNQGLPAIAAAFRRVLALDPGHVGAQQELASLESAWKQGTRETLLNGALETAQVRLEEARTVFSEDVDWLQLQTELTNRQRDERIIVSTSSLLASHGLSDLPSATAAIQSYQEVLRLAPGHTAAQQALTQLSQHYAELASQAVLAGRLTDGISMLERASAADNTVPKLDEVRTLISRAKTAQAAIDDLLQQARRFRSEDKLMLPVGENAAELYRRVLATDPDNAIAAQGLDEITAEIAARADALLLEGQVAQVEVLVSQAQAAGLVEVGVTEMRRRLDTEKTRLQIIDDNLRAANEFMQLGYLTAPPLDNAVAKLREVQQVDPGNAAAIELLQQCAQRLAAVALEAHEHGNRQCQTILGPGYGDYTGGRELDSAERELGRWMN